MTFVCAVCGLVYEASINEDFLRDKRVTPQDVITPDEVIHRCKARNNSWRLMKRQKEKV